MGYVGEFSSMWKIDEVDVDAYISVNDFECIKLPPCNHYEIDPSHNIFKLEWWNSASQEVITRIHSLALNWYSIFIIKIKRLNQQDLYFCCRIETEECNSDSYWGVNNYLLCFKKESINPERMEKLMAQINSCGIVPSCEIVPYHFMYPPKECRCASTTKVPIIKDIYYVAPYTTVKWSDDTITTVKAFEADKFDKELGLAMAIAKKYYECLEAPNPRASIRQAAFKDAHDLTDKVREKRAYKLEKKIKARKKAYEQLSNVKKTRKGQK